MIVLKFLTAAVVIIGVTLWGLIGIAQYKQVNAAKSTISMPLSEPLASVGSLSNDETNPTPPKPAVGTKNTITNPKNIHGMVSPKTLKIPKIGLSADIESVGLDTAGRMAVPKIWNNVGWYSLGYKIGDQGSAVIDGHYDTVTGAPASFYKLGNLNNGDLIQVIDSSGTTLTFKVKSKVSYDWDNLPLSSIFASSGKIGLNLITCGGSWDNKSHNYSKRVVIYSELQ